SRRSSICWSIPPISSIASRSMPRPNRPKLPSEPTSSPIQPSSPRWRLGWACASSCELLRAVMSALWPAYRPMSICLLALSLFSCAGRDRGFDVPVTSSSAQDMTLGPGDTFEVSVYDEKELSGKYRVADDGTINFPLIGPVQAGGRRPTAVASAIQEALAA